jgi:hypothetical protein
MPEHVKSFHFGAQSDWQLLRKMKKPLGLLVSSLSPEMPRQILIPSGVVRFTPDRAQIPW